MQMMASPERLFMSHKELENAFDEEFHPESAVALMLDSRSN